MREIKIYLVFIALTLTTISFGQTKTRLDCNTIFVCLPDEDYVSLFQNSFVKDSLFICKENRTKTGEDDYSGKYFIGEFATLEFFKSSKNKKFGDNLGDIGIEFKTRKIGVLESINRFKTKNKFIIDTIFNETNNEKQLWYNELKMLENKSNLTISLLEYSSDYLKNIGFTNDEMNQELKPDDYNKIVFEGKKYPRKFKSIQSITISVGKSGKSYLKQIAEKFGFIFNEKELKTDDFIIYYKLIKRQKKITLQNIEITLSQDSSEKKIEISPKITITILNKTANIQFLE